MKIKQEKQAIIENSTKIQENKVKYSTELQNQINEHEQLMQQDNLNVLLEKKRMDELIKKYHEDRER